MKTKTKGWKVFDKDLKCRDIQFEVGKKYTQKGEPKLCEHGFHFHTQPSHLFNYYSFDPKNRVCEIVAFGNVDTGADKSCCNEITVGHELSWNEVLILINTGEGNTGRNNTGHRNTGGWNTGDWNTGDWNTGGWNTGDWNTGGWNTGDRNTGDRNTGDRNTGDRNTGHRNTGDRNTGGWNTTNNSAGIFNTIEQPTPIFNGAANVIMSEFMNTDNYQALFLSDFPLTEWISESEMTDQEKIDNPKFHVQEGYLKKRSYKEACSIWWDKMSDRNKKLVQEIPGFSAEIFEEVTGVEL